MVSGKSFMYMRKSNGPSTEPCGTPCLICSHEEVTLSDLFVITTPGADSDKIAHKYVQYRNKDMVREVQKFGRKHK